MNSVLAMFRIEGASRRQLFVRGLLFWLAAPSPFQVVNMANHRWPHIFVDWTLLTGATVALTAELLALRNPQRSYGGFNWMSAACIPFGLSAMIYGMFMAGIILAVLYDHMTSRYDTLSMVVAVLLGIAVLRGIFGVRWQKREYTRMEIAALCVFVPGTVVVFAVTLCFVFREIFPK